MASGLAIGLGILLVIIIIVAVVFLVKSQSSSSDEQPQTQPTAEEQPSSSTSTTTANPAPAAPPSASQPVTLAEVSKPATSLSQFKDPENVDYWGPDIKMLETKDPETCAKTCIDTPNCNLFIASTDSNECWLKTELGPRQPQIKNRNTYVKNSYVASLSQFKDAENVDYEGKDIDHISSSDQYICAKKCLDTPNCNLFITSTDSKDCWLKTKAGTRYPEAKNRMTYMKKSFTPAASFIRYVRSNRNYLHY